MSKNTAIWLVGFVAVTMIVLGGLVIYTNSSEEQIQTMENLTSFSWGYNTEYTLTVPAPAISTGVTHYTVEMSSDYIYLGEEYYDVKEIPESKIIEVHRSGLHQVKILYWIYEYGYYRLAGMGVYEN